jgi:hypothetical protein
VTSYLERQSIRVTTDLATETLKTRKALTDVAQTLKQNNCQPTLVCLAKLYFKHKGEIKTCHDKHTVKILMFSKPVLQKVLNRILHTEEKRRYKHKHKSLDKNKSYQEVS